MGKPRDLTVRDLVGRATKTANEYFAEAREAGKRFVALSRIVGDCVLSARGHFRLRRSWSLHINPLLDFSADEARIYAEFAKRWPDIVAKLGQEEAESLVLANCLKWKVDRLRSRGEPASASKCIQKLEKTTTKLSQIRPNKARLERVLELLRFLTQEFALWGTEEPDGRDCTGT